MPRKSRLVVSNCFHHVMFRGLNGENIFNNDYDRARFCLYLQEACERHSILVHGFCLMSNHIHLILQPVNGNLTSGIQVFSSRYAQFFNRKYERRGYLYQDRYKSIVVDSSLYLMRLLRYVHLNPVTANLVQHPADYKWSSYRAYLGKASFVWLETDLMLNCFGENKEERLKNFINHTFLTIEAQQDLEVIAKAFRKGIFGDEFVDVFNLSNEKAHANEAVKDISSNNTLKDLIEKVCLKFNVKLEDLISTKKEKIYVNARGALAYVVRKSQKWSLEELARLLNKNSGTLSRLAAKIEKDELILNELQQIK